MRVGKKVLGKSIHFHLFRHSSATYYASRLNRQQLCIRYGWSFSSEMCDVYVSRAGMDNKEIDEAMTNTELSDLQLKIQRQGQTNEIQKEEIKELRDKFARISPILEMIEQKMKSNLSPTKVKGK